MKAWIVLKLFALSGTRPPEVGHLLFLPCSYTSGSKTNPAFSSLYNGMECLSLSSVPDYAPCKRAVTIQRIEARAFVRS